MSTALSLLLLVVSSSPHQDLPTVRGVDLNKVPVVADKLKLDDLYVDATDGSGKRARREDVFQMPLFPRQEDSAFLRYRAGADRFYIDYRSDRRNPATEQTFGPIPGNPFAVLGLEQAMMDKAKKDYAPDVYQQIGLMLRTREDGLTRRAFRLLYRLTELDVEGYVLESHTKAIGRIVTKYEKTLQQHVRENQWVRFQEKLVAAEKRLLELIAVIPDEKYTRVAAAEPEVPPHLDDKTWGPTVKGLRMGVVPVKAEANAQYGQTIPLLLVIENNSSAPIRFSVSDVAQTAEATVRLTNREQVKTAGRTWFSGMSPIRRFHLEPNERVVISQVGICAVERQQDARGQFGVTTVVHAPKFRNQVFLAKYALRIGQNIAWGRGPDGVMRRTSPARDEFVGALSTEFTAVAFSKPDDKTEKSEDKP